MVSCYWSNKIYICAGKELFSTYKEMVRENLFMRQLINPKILGIIKFILNMVSRKLLTLNNVLHVVDIIKNLVFDLLSSKNGFEIVFKSDEFILSKCEMFI